MDEEVLRERCEDLGYPEEAIDDILILNSSVIEFKGFLEDLLEEGNLSASETKMANSYISVIEEGLLENE